MTDAARRSFVSGSHTTHFGVHPGATTLSLVDEAALGALADAGLRADQVDALLVGYSTTMPHLMLANVVAERLAIRPRFAQCVSVGGATGASMACLAAILVEAGEAECVLIVAGENRASGATRAQAVQTLAQVGDAEAEVPYGLIVPGYYALLASEYLATSGATETDLAALAVLMHANAAAHPGAHRRDPVTLDDVMRSRPIAAPLKALDCCPISDGACALVVTSRAHTDRSARIAGHGQAHLHQHLSRLDPANLGARDAAARALARAGIDRAAIGLLCLYDSFTITLALLLEELGYAPRGEAGALAAAGAFDATGPAPLNPNGGLLGYGQCGVAAGLAHIAEAYRQLVGRADGLRVAPPDFAYVHGEGGILSAHAALVLARD